jgi:CrcB protein
MGKTILIVGLGGFVGSVARLLLQLAISKHSAVVFPIGTLLVNILGCFLIGLIYGLLDKNVFITPEWRFFLITGVCGGFTTFSTFSYESYTLLREGNYLFGGMYILSSVLLCVLATLLGVSTVSILNKL